MGGEEIAALLPADDAHFVVCGWHGVVVLVAALEVHFVVLENAIFQQFLGFIPFT